jgi:dolichyl-phosphate-mannose--protein O-mannosyl transferase
MTNGKLGTKCSKNWLLRTSCPCLREHVITTYNVRFSYLMIIPNDIYRRIAYITFSVVFHDTMNTSRIFMIAAIAAVTLAFTVGSMVLPVVAQVTTGANTNTQGNNNQGACTGPCAGNNNQQASNNGANTQTIDLSP